MSSLVKDDVVPTVNVEPDGGVAYPVAGAKKVKRPDPRLEYVTGGKNRSSDDPLALPESIDDLTRAFGFSAYDAMMAIPAVSSSINTLKLGIMAGDLQLTETHPAAYYRKTITAEQKASSDIKGFCERMLNRVPGLRGSLLQMLDATLYGNKLAEMTADVATTGPDRGKLVLKTLTVKHRKSWLFVVDNSLNVKGILARNGGERQGYQILPPEKFMWLTWMPHNNDPRGSSAARTAYNPGNMTVQMYAEYFRYAKQFASPSVIGKPDPDSENVVDDAGNVITPTMVLLSQLELFGNGSALVVPAGAEIQVVLPQGNGEAFLKGFSFLDRQMVFGILGQTRATMEAEHGSKADSEQGDDILDLIIAYGRDNFGDTIRNQMLKPLVSANFGEEASDLYTPYVYFGSNNPKDRVSGWNALANLYRSIDSARAINPVTRSTQQEWHALTGSPIPDQDEDLKALQEDLERQKAQEPEPQDAPGSGQDAPGQTEDDGDGEFTQSHRRYARWLRGLQRKGVFSGR
jgi:hypothetical protein